MKKVLSIILTLVLMLSVLPFGLFTITANAETEYYSGYTGACRWVQSGKTLTISGNGEMADYITTSHPWSTSITSVIIGNGVTRIGQYAFNNCTEITAVDIPNSVTSIGYGAFFGCTSLSTITIPDSVTSIGNGAFDKTAYYNDDSNWEEDALYIDKHLVETKEYIFGSYIVKSGTLTIADYAFHYGNNYLSAITIPDSVTHIGKLAFVSCYELTSVTLGSGVQNIGYRAFNSCSKLTDVYYNGSKDDKKNISINDGNSYLTGALWHYAKGDILEYTYNDDDLTAEVIDCLPDAVDVSIPSTVVKDGKTYTVTSIGSHAFDNHTSLISIKIPNSVTSIGEWAFYGCTELASITIPDSVTSIDDYAFCNTAYYNDDSNWENGVLYIGKHLINADTTISGKYSIKKGTVNIADNAFGSCSNLTSVIIPDSVISIGAGAFSYCSGLTSITIPDSVTSIGYRVFYDCTSLASITVPDSVTNIGDDAFYNTAYYNQSSNWQNGGLYIGKHFIEAKTTVSGEFSVKEGTLTIANSAFSSCESLKSIDVPYGVTSIGVEAFYKCSSLTSITIPDTVTSIGDGAFSQCSGLTTVIIPDGVTSIGVATFYYCSNLTSITIPESVKCIGKKAFWNCTSLTSVTVPDSVTNIGDFAFRNCEKLVSAVLGKDVTRIGDYAFYDCYSLTSIVLPSNVTAIGEWAFCQCTSLTSITIGNSITSIGYAAFYKCTSLVSVTYGGTENDWAEISIGTGNDNLLNADITYAKQHPKPSAPTLAYEGGGMVVLNSVDGVEYSLDGVNWQASSIFTGLKENTEYTFYCRVAATDSMLASEPSDGLRLTTSLFYTKPATPSAPTVQNITGTTVTLVAVSGHEYSIDGETWQTSNVFEGLSPNTEYNFYCRLAETNTSYASDASEPTVVTTLKLTVSAPAKPKLAFEGNGMVILNTASGCEYSRDGVNWQTGNIFEGLRPNKTYTFYCRIPETNTTYEAVSEGLTVTTSDFEYTPNCDTNNDSEVTSADAVYLMYYVLFGNADYPVNMDCDFNNDGVVTEDDAVYLLYHVLFGEEYPLS